MKSILILGGARSGKSSFAQNLASELGGTVTFVATAEAGDEDMYRRIAEHRRSRPESWQTVEAQYGIGKAIKKQAGKSDVVIIDCITMLVSNIMLKSLRKAPAEELVLKEIETLVRCMGESPATFILVSNEVGMGLVPDNELGRRYRDILGQANQLLAKSADEIYLMVTGVPIKLK
ncbi:MAG: bifunctional adenosylcobinamide kinase/adenosylcobinamide-phosphate guanylyltransferase [Dehalococcoidales bacterium]|nr:bifunctional adenosylcobinamide kinase/adenosylcobinamide-phosphate guanylyltransferase [Dehalococcoidales bacterium]